MNSDEPLNITVKEKINDRTGKISELAIAYKIWVPSGIRRRKPGLRENMYHVKETEGAILLMNSDGMKEWLPKNAIETKDLQEASE